MSGNKGLEFLDYLVFLTKWKKLLLILTISSFILSYLAVYYFIDVEYQATSTIIPSEDNSLGGLAALAKSFSSLPIGIGNLKKSSEMDIYNTILFSRTSVENLADTFKLEKYYKFKNREEKIKMIASLISTSVTLENAFVVKVSAKTPELAANMANYLVDYLNNRVIELNTSKSRENRLFLEQRYQEIKQAVKISEDSLKFYQQHSGVLEAENQTKSTIEAYAKMDAELAQKQIELAILKKVYGENSVQVTNSDYAVNEYKDKIEQLKSGNDPNSMFIPMKSIPAKIMNYARLYRNVKINNEMLEFIIPLYEQAKFEEQKATPVLQVIDRAIQPERKSYPPRTLFALFITIAVLTFAGAWIIIKEVMGNSQNPKLLFIKRNLFGKTLNITK